MVVCISHLGKSINVFNFEDLESFGLSQGLFVKCHDVVGIELSHRVAGLISNW